MMKKSLVIFFTTIVLLASMSKGFIYLVFKFQQSEIIENLCINKDKPMMHCDGKCFLKNQLEEKNNDTNTPNPFSNLEESLKLIFPPLVVEEQQSDEDQGLRVRDFPVFPFNFQSYFTSQPHPPEFLS